jgi:virginiamycin A acetyltransferase
LPKAKAAADASDEGRGCDKETRHWRGRKRQMKFAIKKILLFIALLADLPLIVITWLTIKLIGGDTAKKIFIYCGEILSICPTIIGMYLRKAYYWATCTGVSPDVHFLFGCMLAHREVTIRKGVIIGPYTFIGYADIGENVLFGGRVSVISGKYQHGRPDQRIAQQEVEEQHEVILIGKNSWIGSDATILANIGDNCTVGAGSVVLKEVPEGTTVLGNPARKVNM